MLGAGVIFVLSPLIIRWVWDTRPLPQGDLRQRLVAMCEQYGVGVRELLLWRTFGGMVNGAVMGFLGPVRYILLTDALLDALPTPQVEAVMAHELAHIRRHHMFWMMAAAATAMIVLSTGFRLGLDLVIPYVEPRAQGRRAVAQQVQAMLASDMALETIAYVPAVGCWFFVFGWVSRRFERQADTFAVQHMAQLREQEQREEAPGDDDATPVPLHDAAPPRKVVIDAASARTMIDALQQVADLNHIATRRRSWRHGSIAWRQGYLRSLIGRAANDLSIDRQVRWIKGATALVAAGVVALLVTGWVQVAI